MAKSTLPAALFAKRGPDDYAIEHCEADNGTVGCDYIGDWIAETFGLAVA